MTGFTTGGIVIMVMLGFIVLQLTFMITTLMRFLDRSMRIGVRVGDKAIEVNIDGKAIEVDAESAKLKSSSRHLVGG